MKKFIFAILSMCLWASLLSGCDLSVLDSSSIKENNSFISSEASGFGFLVSSSVISSSESAVSSNTSFISSASVISSSASTSSIAVNGQKPVSSKTHETPSSKVTESKLVSSAPAPVTQPPEGKLTLISVTSPIGRNETATLTAKGKPNTQYTISVYYSTTASKAEGLEPKMSDANGNVTWSWKVGGRTNSGSHRIVVAGGDQKLETSFTTTE